jgi:hypothetical protein
MTLTVQSRPVGPTELEQIRQLLQQHPEWSRSRLSQALCELWAWRSPKGQLQDMAARALLLKLEQRGCLVLPPRRSQPPNRMRQKRFRPVAHDTEPIRAALPQLRPLAVCELSQSPADLPLYQWLLHHYHYLGYTGTVGLNLKYLVRDCQGRPLSCLLFGSAAWKCAVRDQFIGWSPAARQARLQQVANNTRFLILPWAMAPQLASHVLSLVLGRLRQDWQAKYARPLELVETFVDASRFSGVCYRAANWTDLGQTTGRTRQDRWSRIKVPPKRVLVYPLSARFREVLSA